MGNRQPSTTTVPVSNPEPSELSLSQVKNWGEERMEEFSRQSIVDPCVRLRKYILS